MEYRKGSLESVLVYIKWNIGIRKYIIYNGGSEGLLVILNE